MTLNVISKFFWRLTIVAGYALLQCARRRALCNN
jgi:hypothetical protein